jgi:hypothetical protein
LLARIKTTAASEPGVNFTHRPQQIATTTCRESDAPRSGCRTYRVLLRGSGVHDGRPLRIVEGLLLFRWSARLAEPPVPYEPRRVLERPVSTR